MLNTKISSKKYDIFGGIFQAIGHFDRTTQAMTIKRNLNKFLEEYPLYKPFEAVVDYSRDCEGYTDPFMLYRETFNSYCSIEKEIRVFELTLSESFKDFWGKFLDDGIHNSLIDENERLNYIQYFEGICTSCKKHKIAFLLHVYSDHKIPRETGSIIFTNSENDQLFQQPVKIFIEKVGEYPKHELNIGKEISKILDRESSNWYYKAQASLNENFGIGAFAYFRRIIEKELINLAKKVSELNHTKSKEIKNLLLEYERNNKVHLIYENIYDFLPPSLKSLGDNPFSLLYKQTSLGLHELTEQECLVKAEAINYVLTFLIKKLYEEKVTLSDTKKYINELKK